MFPSGELTRPLKRLAVYLFASAVFLGSGSAMGQPGGQIGQVSQPLVLGPPTDPVEVERRGLVRVRKTLPGPTPGTTSSWICSGTLIQNDWVLTAAHCVEHRGTLVGPGQVTVIRGWDGTNAPATRELITFRPADVALVRLSRPVLLNGNTFGYRHTLDPTGVYPPQVGSRVLLFGAGINRYAFRDSSGQNHPTSSDGAFRNGTDTITILQHGTYGIANAPGIAGGDSGGPTFRENGELIGVHSTCNIECLLPNMCPSDSWTWVKNAGPCFDASVHPHRAQIDQVIAERTPPEAPLMGVRRDQRSTTYFNPVIVAENGIRMRLDFCRRFGAACGREAADAFCARENPQMSIAQSHRVANDIGMTAVISNGQVCDAPECDGFASITCGIPLTEEDRRRAQLENQGGVGDIVREQIDADRGRLDDRSPINPQRFER